MNAARIVTAFLPKLVDTCASKHNHTIQVYLLRGTYRVVVDNLTQSGGLVKTIWKTALKKIHKKNHQVTSALILGYGTGSAAEAIQQFWPKASITGIEIDPVMIMLGKKYFSINKNPNITVINADAFKWLKNSTPGLNTPGLKSRQDKSNPQSTSFETNSPRIGKFDLILVDLYVGKHIPKLATTQSFINQINRHFAPGGIALFNRLDIKDTKHANQAFHHLLEQSFPRVSTIKTPANRIFSASK